MKDYSLVDLKHKACALTVVLEINSVRKQTWSPSAGIKEDRRFRAERTEPGPNHEMTYVTSMIESSRIRNRFGSFISSDHPIISLQLYPLASFSPAPAKLPDSSSFRPLQIRNSRVKTQGSAATVMSTAAAIFAGLRKRYAMFLCRDHAAMLLLGNDHQQRSAFERMTYLIKFVRA